MFYSLSVSDVYRFYGIPHDVIRKYLRSGKINGVKNSRGHWVIIVNIHFFEAVKSYRSRKRFLHFKKGDEPF